jgi:hypothetical protein
MSRINVSAEAQPIDEFQFGSTTQEERAKKLGAEKILKLQRGIRSRLGLPYYLLKQCEEMGYQIDLIESGGTTNSNSVWALYK